MKTEHSYVHGSFADNGKERGRLELQAKLALQRELQVLDQHGLRDARRILDLGCGPGITAAAIAERNPSCEVTGVDLDGGLIARNATQFGHLANLAFEQGSVYDPKEDELGRYDFIYCRFVFQHLARPNRALESCKERLAPSGRLCIADVDDRWLSLEPVTPAYSRFIELAQVAQKKRGGDRFIGAKIPVLLHQCGYADVKATITVITTTDIPKPRFAEVVFGYKKESIVAVMDCGAERLLREIEETVMQPEAWGGVGVVFSSACR